MSQIDDSNSANHSEAFLRFEQEIQAFLKENEEEIQTAVSGWLRQQLFQKFSLLHKANEVEDLPNALHTVLSNIKNIKDF